MSEAECPRSRLPGRDDRGDRVRLRGEELRPAGRHAGLISSVHAALGRLGTAGAGRDAAARPTPPVSIKKSVTDDYLISLEDGRKFKSLKRYLAASA